MIGKYSKEIEEDMVYLFSLIDEKHKRYYASVEAIKLGHGGISYISGLFRVSEKTLERGIKELKRECLPQRIRRTGGGRKAVLASEALTRAFTTLIETPLAGNPQNDQQWTHLTPREVRV